MVDLDDVWDVLSHLPDVISGGIKSMLHAILTLLQPIYDTVSYIKTLLVKTWTMVTKIKAWIGDTGAAITGYISQLADFLKDVPGHVATWFTTALSWVLDQASGLVSCITSSFNWMVSQIPGPYMVVAPIIVIAVVGVGYLLVRVAFWVYHQIPILG